MPNINIPNAGLNTDSNPAFQNKDSYLFALNAILGNESGNTMLIGNENSNIECAKLKDDYVVLGHCYIGDDETCIFSVKNDNTVSEIGILKDCIYTPIIETSTLQFSVNHQIEAIYRLRRGCEKTIYWTDNLNPPRQFNFNRPNDYKNKSGNWSNEQFNIQNTAKSIPLFHRIFVDDAGGNLLPGAYQIGIQYIDKNNNATEWMNISQKILIYSDSLSSPIEQIQGSIHHNAVEALQFPETNKSISIELKNLDTQYEYIRLCIIAFHDGIGKLSNIYVTDKFAISYPKFTFTGTNYVSTINEEELLQFQNIIATAKHIQQLDNKLLLGNVTSKSVEWCKFQKYASLIKADCVVKEIALDSLYKTDKEDIPSNEDNPKHPLQFFNGAGYTPGEMYSFGIVYILKDGTTSPVFHIPGKPTDDENKIYNQNSNNVYPMALNNTIDTLYDNSNSCDNSDYWGLDYNGKRLVNTNVRHHRFPTRSKVNIPHIKTDNDTYSIQYELSFILKGKYYLDVACKEEDVDCERKTYLPLDIRISINEDLIKYNQEKLNFINSGSEVNYEVDKTKDVEATITLNNLFNEDLSLDRFEIEVKHGDDWIKWEDYVDDEDGVYLQHFSEKPTIEIQSEVKSEFKSTLKSTIFGIQFSNVIKPELSEIGEEIVGYYIVQQERTQEFKSVIDTGVIIPAMRYKDYVGVGLLAPEENVGKKQLYDKAFGLLTYTQLFQNYDFGKNIYIEQEGTFSVVDRTYTFNLVNDVLDGSTYKQLIDNKDTNFDNADDKNYGIDGFSAYTLFRDNQTAYSSNLNSGTFNIEANEISQLTLLNPFDSCYINDKQLTFVDVMSDQPIICLETYNSKSYNFYDDGDIQYPYVVIRKKLNNAYSNFRIAPYFKLTNNYNVFADEIDNIRLYNGDTFVSAIRFDATSYYDVEQLPVGIRKRSFWEKAWGYIASGLVLVGGVVAAFFTGGASLAVASIVAGTILAGAGGILLTVSRHIKYSNMIDVIQNKYKKGLRETLEDDWIKANLKESDFNHPSLKEQTLKNPSYQSYMNGKKIGFADDTYIYISDTLSSLWFESDKNAFLRVGMTKGLPAYLVAPGKFRHFDYKPYKYVSPPNGVNEYTSLLSFEDDILGDTDIEIFTNQKLFQIDPEKGGRTFNAIPLPEFYCVNPDYIQTAIYQKYFMLASEYDCCSDCREKFPHRWMWSEQSFDEEKFDNYSILKPNNYTDIPGDTGEITNLIVISDNLYIHTEEALWLQPRNYQERVTDQIVTYIGSGEYGGIKPRKIVDDKSGLSAGLQSKWSSLKNKYGYFFISENDKVVYLFNGQLNAISNTGMKRWFENHIPMNSELYQNNPSNPLGSGFHLGYDTYNDRLLITKQDKTLNINYSNDVIIGNQIFYDFENYKKELSKDGWVFDKFVKVNNIYKAQFKKITITQELETTYVNGFPDIDYLLFYYDFSSTGRRDLDNITELIINGSVIGTVGWGQGYSDPEKLIVHCGDNVGTGLESFYLNIKKIKQLYPNVTNIQFVTYGNWYLSANRSNMGNPATIYLRAIPYKGGEMTLSGYQFKNVNGEVLSTTENGYPLDPKSVSTFSGDSSIDLYTHIGTYDFNIDTGKLICDGEEIEAMKDIKIKKEVLVEKRHTELKLIEGELLFNILNDDLINQYGWTLSYSLLNNRWISFHSYIPNVYINNPDNFYSVVSTNNTIWKHNHPYNYQQFYNKNKQFIIEYIDKDNVMINSITDDIVFQTEALKYDNESNNVVDCKLITFNKAVLYNSKQCSGELIFRIKDENLSENYLEEQVLDNGNIITLDKHEREWSFNNFRDIRIDYSKPIWNVKESNLNNDYMDKELNIKTLDINKLWTELEPFRDKYLIIRFIFDNFDNESQQYGLYKLVVNHFIHNTNISIR